MRRKNSDTLTALLRRRYGRREVLIGSGGLLATSLVAGCDFESHAAAAPLGFRRIRPSASDTVTVPDGYTSRVILRWGDPIFPGAPAMDANAAVMGSLLEPGAAAAQALQFGTNCDGIGLFPRDERRTIVCVNHEFCTPELMFPGWRAASSGRSMPQYVLANPEAVHYMQASLGISVVEIDGSEPVLGSPFNRRITASTRIELSGPAADHDLFGADREIVYGTLGNCAAGTTPWGTYLTAEENVHWFFGNGLAADFDAQTARAHARLGFRRRSSLFGWEYIDSRFDLARNPSELLKFGWIVEIDPFDPQSTPKKRTALGRFKHEAATSTLTNDGRVSVYMGDDESFEYFYKFVSRDRVDLGNPESNRDLLDQGTLYVAKLYEDGSGEWLALVWNETDGLGPANGFHSQGDVVLNCREAADRVGATPLDRPEDVAVDPDTQAVYLSCTQNTLRGGARTSFAGRELDSGPDHANPRAPNPGGHILEFVEQGDDAAATRFYWEPFILAGRPTRENLATSLVELATRSSPDVTYFGGYPHADEISAFTNPDNLICDRRGNIWIVTDGMQPGGTNDGCFVCPMRGESRGAVHQFMSGPVGCEICGCEVGADGRSLYLTVQHPGSGGSVEAPRSHWPDGGDAIARSSLIVITPDDEDALLGD
jgi:secreted PhoX family phosphatase